MRGPPYQAPPLPHTFDDPRTRRDDSVTGRPSWPRMRAFGRPARSHRRSRDGLYRMPVPVRAPEPRLPGPPVPPVPRLPGPPPVPWGVLPGPGPCGSPGCPGGKSGGSGFGGVGCPGAGPGFGVGPGCGPGRLLVCAREVVSGAAETTNRNTQPARFNAIVCACLSRGSKSGCPIAMDLVAAFWRSRSFTQATTVPRCASRARAGGFRDRPAYRRFLCRSAIRRRNRVRGEMVSERGRTSRDAGSTVASRGA